MSRNERKGNTKSSRTQDSNSLGAKHTEDLTKKIDLVKNVVPEEWSVDEIRRVLEESNYDPHKAIENILEGFVERQADEWTTVGNKPKKDPKEKASSENKQRRGTKRGSGEQQDKPRKTGGKEDGGVAPNAQRPDQNAPKTEDKPATETKTNVDTAGTDQRGKEQRRRDQPQQQPQQPPQQAQKAQPSTQQPQQQTQTPTQQQAQKPTGQSPVQQQQKPPQQQKAPQQAQQPVQQVQAQKTAQQPQTQAQPQQQTASSASTSAAPASSSQASGNVQQQQRGGYYTGSPKAWKPKQDAAPTPSQTPSSTTAQQTAAPAVQQPSAQPQQTQSSAVQQQPVQPQQQQPAQQQQPQQPVKQEQAPTPSTQQPVASQTAPKQQQQQQVSAPQQPAQQQPQQQSTPSTSVTTSSQPSSTPSTSSSSSTYSPVILPARAAVDTSLEFNFGTLNFGSDYEHHYDVQGKQTTQSTPTQQAFTDSQLSDRSHLVGNQPHVMNPVESDASHPAQLHYPYHLPHGASPYMQPTGMFPPYGFETDGRPLVTMYDQQFQQPPYQQREPSPTESSKFGNQRTSGAQQSYQNQKYGSQDSGASNQQSSGSTQPPQNAPSSPAQQHTAYPYSAPIYGYPPYMAPSQYSYQSPQSQYYRQFYRYPNYSASSTGYPAPSSSSMTTTGYPDDMSGLGQEYKNTMFPMTSFFPQVPQQQQQGQQQQSSATSTKSQGFSQPSGTTGTDLSGNAAYKGAQQDYQSASYYMPQQYSQQTQATYPYMQQPQAQQYNRNPQQPYNMPGGKF